MRATVTGAVSKVAVFPPNVKTVVTRSVQRAGFEVSVSWTQH